MERIQQTVLVSGCSQGWDVQMANTRLHRYETYRLLLVYSLRSSIWLFISLSHIHLSVSLSKLLLSVIFIFLVMPSASEVSSEVRAHTCLCVARHWCVSVSQSIPVFDYGSWEATGPRWPRRPQASQVSEASIPRWLLHSCENRKAAPTTNTPGAGGKTANLWLINNRSFHSPQQDLFPIFFFQNCWLKGNKACLLSSFFSPLPTSPCFLFGLLVQRFKEAHASCSVAAALFVCVRWCLFYSSVSWICSSFHQEGCGTVDGLGLLSYCK